MASKVVCILILAALTCTITTAARTLSSMENMMNSSPEMQKTFFHPFFPPYTGGFGHGGPFFGGDIGKGVGLGGGLGSASPTGVVGGGLGGGLGMGSGEGDELGSHNSGWHHKVVHGDNKGDAGNADEGLP